MNNRNFIHNMLICIPITLVGISVIMVYSSSSIFASQKFNDSAFFLKRQFLFGIVGLLAMFVTMKIPYRLYKRLAYPLWLLSLVLLVLVLIPGVGSRVGGASRWLRFGALSFQPAEFTKLAMVILLAYSLSKKEHKIKSFSIGLMPHLIFVLPVTALVILQPDFGTAVMLVFLLFVLLFVAGVPMRFLLVMGVVATAGVALLIACKGYRVERFFAYLNPWGHYQGSGFQIVQSYLAFGSGGVWGTGLGNGTQKLFYLPELHTDFIFSVIGEEWGLFGVLFVILLYGMLLFCGVQVAMNAFDLFGTYLALGIILLIGLQSFINMGVVMGLLPTKGTTLPFISYGGTSLVVNLTGVGILLGISTQSDCRARK